MRATFPTSLAITVHDYLEMREGPPYYQLIEGELAMSPSPNWRHQEIAIAIAEIIRSFLRKKGLRGRVFVAPLDVILNDFNVFQPDVLYFSEEKASILGERCIEGAPDFVVEILSDSTAHFDRGPKRKIYARTGVSELWIVNPELKEIGVYDLPEDSETPKATYRGKDKFSSPLFPGLKFSCTEIFRGV
jgi:Uma2 family endonuclease